MGKVSLLFIVCLGLPQISHITHFTLRALLTYFACCCTVLARFIELCVCACGALFVCLCVCGGFAAGVCCALLVRLWWLCCWCAVCVFVRLWWLCCWCVLCVACASVVALLLVRAVRCLCVCGGFAAGACCVLSVRLWWLWCWCVLCVACASVVALLLVRAVFCLCVCSGFAAGASA